MILTIFAGQPTQEEMGVVPERADDTHVWAKELRSSHPLPDGKYSLLEESVRACEQENIDVIVMTNNDKPFELLGTRVNYVRSAVTLAEMIRELPRVDELRAFAAMDIRITRGLARYIKDASRNYAHADFVYPLVDGRVTMNRGLRKDLTDKTYLLGEKHVSMGQLFFAKTANIYLDVIAQGVELFYPDRYAGLHSQSTTKSDKGLLLAKKYFAEDWRAKLRTPMLAYHVLTLFKQFSKNKKDPSQAIGTITQAKKALSYLQKKRDSSLIELPFTQQFEIAADFDWYSERAAITASKNVIPLNRS